MQKLVDNCKEAYRNNNLDKASLECLLHNNNLLEEVCKQTGIEYSTALEQGAEYCDGLIRDYLLPQAISKAIDNRADEFDKAFEELDMNAGKLIEDEDEPEQYDLEETKKLKVIFKEVGKDPVVMEIDDTLEAKQKLVGGLIEVVPYKDDLLLICNEEGKITNLKPNLQFDYDYIAGNCFVVGDDYENSGFKSIEDSQIEDIKKDLEDRAIVLEELEEDEEDEDEPEQ